MSSMDSTTPENLLLRRRNPVTLPTKLNLQSSPPTPATSSASTSTSSASSSNSSTNSDCELFSIKPVTYTSLRDLLPPVSNVNSPTPSNESSGGSEISIRNHLVKQAAWAYLQPMSSSPDSAGRSLFSRLFSRSAAEIDSLSMEERRLDERVREMQEKLRDMSEDENNQSLPCFQNETLIAVKAPHGTTLEVPDPDEAVDYPQRRYRIILRSTMGPIDVYLVSQFEEKFDEMNGVEPSAAIPVASSSGSMDYPAMERSTVSNSVAENEGQTQNVDQLSSDLGTAQDYSGGMMKILPSDVDNDADYWLLSDANVSITDMWKTDSTVEWDGEALLRDFAIDDLGTPRAHAPSTTIADIPAPMNVPPR